MFGVGLKAGRTQILGNFSTSIRRSSISRTPVLSCRPQLKRYCQFSLYLCSILANKFYQFQHRSAGSVFILFSTQTFNLARITCQFRCRHRHEINKPFSQLSRSARPVDRQPSDQGHSGQNLPRFPKRARKKKKKKGWGGGGGGSPRKAENEKKK